MHGSCLAIAVALLRPQAQVSQRDSEPSQNLAVRRLKPGRMVLGDSESASQGRNQPQRRAEASVGTALARPAKGQVQRPPACGRRGASAGRSDSRESGSAGVSVPPPLRAVYTEATRFMEPHRSRIAEALRLANPGWVRPFAAGAKTIVRCCSGTHAICHLLRWAAV
jgi:hypothetical protein